MWVALPGTRRKGVSTPQAFTTPSAISLSRTGWPTVFTRSRNSASLPGLMVYSYQNVSGCIGGCDCCAKLEIQDNNMARKQKNRRVFIFDTLRESFLPARSANVWKLWKVGRCGQALNILAVTWEPIENDEPCSIRTGPRQETRSVGELR